MKYNVHLSTGAVISMELDERWREVTDPHPDGWLVDDAGVAVKVDAVVAFVPDRTPALAPEVEALPSTVRDGEGDLWTRNDGGTYDCDRTDLDQHLRGWALSKIDRRFGLQ